jgi:hypothetical protein
LQLLNLNWGFYLVGEGLPLRPAIPASVAALVRVCISALPSLPGSFGLCRIDATTKDSDFSRRPRRLAGATGLCSGLGRVRPTTGDLPAYPGFTSRPVARADPAGTMSRLLTVCGRLLAAFPHTARARLSGSRYFGTHSMRFTFVATGLSNRRWPPCAPRGCHVSTVFRREQSNSPGGTCTRVETSFAGCCAVSMQWKTPSPCPFPQGERGFGAVGAVDLFTKP